MPTPRIGVVVPVRNESANLQQTLESIVGQRTTDEPIELIVVDDASSDGCTDVLAVDDASVHLRVHRLSTRRGVAVARNRGADIASAEILFITDSHVRFPPGWDEYVLDHVHENTVVAATITDAESSFEGHGCTLVVPFMGTRWNREKTLQGESVQIASSAGTVLHRDLFERIGGYDEDMLYYGGIEPEFSVRAWLSGARITAHPSLTVEHQFKERSRRNRFIDEMRPFMIHNNLRFGLLYLNKLASLQMVRHFSQLFPGQIQQALQLVADSTVWDRRDHLASSLAHDFDWFVDRFDVTDQVGERIIGTP